jgi:hypothetical protein
MSLLSLAACPLCNWPVHSVARHCAAVHEHETRARLANPSDPVFTGKLRENARWELSALDYQQKHPIPMDHHGGQ